MSSKCEKVTSANGWVRDEKVMWLNPARIVKDVSSVFGECLFDIEMFLCVTGAILSEAGG